MNKLRTLLTGFAVGWGILILVILLSSGIGISRGIARNVASQGLNNASVQLSFGWLSKPINGLPRYYEPVYTIEDCERIQQQMPEDILLIAPYLRSWGIEMTHGDKFVSSVLLGVTDAYAQVVSLRFKARASRFINVKDQRDARKVIVLSEYAARELFGDEESALGKQVEVRHVYFTVVGVHKDNKGKNADCFVPLSTMHLLRLSSQWQKPYSVTGMQMLCPSVQSDEAEQAMKERVRRFCAGLKGFSLDDETAIRLSSQATLLGSIKQVIFGMDIFLWLIGLSTLVIGVVGVINIMQIAVTERRREIGIRKALGAKSRDIISMILVESVFVTLISGLIGLIVGVGVMAFVDRLMIAKGWGVTEIGDFKNYLFVNPNITVSTALGAILVMVLGGLLAGYLPARKALRVPTVEAMRQ